MYISSDSDEESTEEVATSSRKRKLSEVDPENQPNDCQKSSEGKRAEETTSEKLPVPGDILQMFASKDASHSDDPSKHGGRVRTFAHERGNWASYVYIPFDDDSWCRELSDSLVKCLRLTNDFQMVDHFHISLSRTFVMRHHWIDPMVESLRLELAAYPGTLVDFSSVETYTNDEKTRTFVGIKVCSGSDMLRRYMSAIDRSLDEFKLPKYYENPSFHLSVAWCVGDVKAKIPKDQIEDLQRIIDEYFCSNPRSSVAGVRNLMLKTGNKQFVLRNMCK